MKPKTIVACIAIVVIIAFIAVNNMILSWG